MSTFGFRASAAAMGGMFTRPFHEPLQVQAASNLPSVGGYGSARVEHFRFHQLVSFTGTQVIGVEYVDEERRERSTLALSVVEDLNVLDMVTADRVVGRLVSETPLPADEDERAAVDAQELTWLPAGSYFENLRIGGHLIEPTAHESLAGKSILNLGRKAFLPESGAAVRCRDVEQLPGARPGIPVRCSMLPGSNRSIAGFGEVFLGNTWSDLTIGS
jgi:hypothetical protein